MKKLGSVFGLFCMLFAFAACSSGGDDGSGNGGGYSDVIDNGDGTVTLKIEEEKDGYVSTTGSLKTGDTSWIGYSGKGYIESLTKGKQVVYTVNAEADITDAQIAVHYGMWNAPNQVRGVLVSVNGIVINDGGAIKTTYTSKGTKGQADSNRWKDSVFLKNVTLSQGTNSIIIEGAPAVEQNFNNEAYTPSDDGCLPNIDYILVKGKRISFGTDKTPYYALTVKSENETAGTVSCSVSASSVKEGTSVTLTATAKSGWKFDCWAGTEASRLPEHTFTMTKHTVVYAHFIPNDYDVNDGPEGYASITDDNGTSYTITGGAGGEEITISTLDDLDANKSILSGNEPYVVTFTERITTSDDKSIILNIGSNKTIYGKAGANAGLKNIEMRVEGSNVIIRNMVFGEVIAYDGQSYSGSGNDALSLNGASHVWVDHCELKSNTKPVLNDGNVPQNPGDEDFKKDFYDGLLDIKNGATWITISNCYFHDHYKAVLCGSGDENPDTSPAGISDRDMRVTFAGNYFKNINARMPLFRWGKGHIYNSYFDAGEFSSDASCINVRAESELYIESNTFVGMKSGYAIGFYYDTNASRTGKWVSSNNTGASKKNDTVDKPKYSYEPSRPAEAPTDVGAVLSADKL